MKERRLEKLFLMGQWCDISDTAVQILFAFLCLWRNNKAINCFRIVLVFFFCCRFSFFSSLSVCMCWSVHLFFFFLFSALKFSSVLKRPCDKTLLFFFPFYFSFQFLILREFIQFVWETTDVSVMYVRREE